jgi:beta-phosphoglucomutase
MSTKIEAIIFDMDGVLIDAKDWHYEALNRALTLFGMEISRYDHLVTYDGLPTKKKLEMLTLERGLPRELHDFINELKQRFTLEAIYTKCRPTFTHQYMFVELKKLKYRIAVCSNSVRDSIELMLGKADLLHYLDAIYSNEDVSHPKPDPEMYVKAMQKLGVKPSGCMIVEDNPNGILAAQRSGAHVMQVAEVAEANLENVLENIRFFESKSP